MRKLVNPPPWSRCGLCSGEMRLKLIVPADRTCDLENEIFVCANCGHERTFTVMHDPYTPHIHTAHRKDVCQDRTCSGSKGRGRRLHWYAFDQPRAVTGRRDNSET